MTRKLVVHLIMVAAAAVSHAQNKPAGPCNLPDAGLEDAFKGQPTFALTPARAVHAWMGCTSAKNCIPVSFAAGSPVLIFNTQGTWTCGYAEDAHGAAPAWFRSADLGPVHLAPNPSFSSWAGTWTQGSDRIRISVAKKGELHIRGNATWHGIKGVEHYGDFDDTASPNGNRLHVGSDNSQGCAVDMMLIGSFILANDNEQCGGMNVRFEGFWRRSTQH